MKLGGADRRIDQGTQHVQVIGQMPTYTTVTGFVVTPVVALVDASMTLQADPPGGADRLWVNWWAEGQAHPFTKVVLAVR